VKLQVNGSGQFVGVAEMIGKVDFNKSMDFWQLDKWSGFFPVKWHIVKDIPNSQLRHILLENNENRPVTYTRDTQEVMDVYFIVNGHSFPSIICIDCCFWIQVKSKLLPCRLYLLEYIREKSIYCKISCARMAEMHVKCSKLL